MRRARNNGPLRLTKNLLYRQLGLHGAQVTIMGRRSKLLDQAVAKLKEEGIKAFSAPGDVRKPVGEVPPVKSTGSSSHSIRMLRKVFRTFRP